MTLRALVGRAGNINDLLTLYNQAKAHYGTARKWYRDRTRWTVTVSEDDPIYPTAHTWFVGLLDEGDPPRSVEARMESNYDKSIDTRVHRLRIYYDQTAARRITIAGHLIVVELIKPGGSSRVDAKNASGQVVPDTDGEDSWSRWTQPHRLKFHTDSREAQQAVLELLRGLVERRPERRPTLWLAGSWGGWQKREDLPPRPLESVVLAAGQMERIVADLDQFLRSEAEYNRRGIPWHRGYLLYGPPGTGKTSTPRALAAHLGMDLFYAPLGDMSSDFKLLNAVSEVRARSILLLEDLDVYQAARDRDDDQAGPHASMASLLNALDGVATPHGLVTFITSNRPDVIDPALIRPGRVDLREAIGLPDLDQFGRLFEAFYDMSYAWFSPSGEGKSSTADYIEVFKRHMDDPHGALRELGAL